MTESTLVFTNGDKAIGEPIVSSWTSASGIVVTVRTYKASAGQSTDDWHTAHDAYFATMWAAFPPP